jgi:hypothetical protein
MHCREIGSGSCAPPLALAPGHLEATHSYLRRAVGVVICADDLPRRPPLTSSVRPAANFPRACP